MIIDYFAFFVLLSVALFSVMEQMSIALDYIDIESFILWAGVASVMATLPASVLW
jgi:hypothetical protein